MVASRFYIQAQSDQSSEEGLLRIPEKGERFLHDIPAVGVGEGVTSLIYDYNSGFSWKSDDYVSLEKALKSLTFSAHISVLGGAKVPSLLFDLMMKKKGGV